MLRLTIATALVSCVIGACSKSAVEATVDTTNKVGTKLMSGVVQKDASIQVEGLIRNLEDRPECDVYRTRLREIERSSPYEGATQSVIVRTYGAAGKADCVKP